MSKIKIKNFGPIKEGLQGEDGWMDIRPVTLFIGNQGSGKSTVAKLISTLTWIEKALVRGDYPQKEFTQHNRFKKKYCSYHRLENYFRNIDGVDRAEIEYEGIAYKFSYRNERFTITSQRQSDYQLPQIMYVPAERNFISTIDNPRMIKLSSGPLVDFLEEFTNAASELKESVALPINQTKVEYDRNKEIVNIKGTDYKLRLTEASSGYQSAVPLYLVSRHLAETVKQQTENGKQMSSDELKRFRSGVELIWDDKNMTENQRKAALSALTAKFRKSSFINIVEEPEQNLYPSSQRQMLNTLLEFTNLNNASKLILTTHSPYIISYLTLAIKAESLLTRGNALGRQEFRDRVQQIVPVASCVPAGDTVVYELTEDGKIIRLSEFEGIPSDENFLNQKLAETNDLFDALLEIEEQYADQL